jgi:protein phosphatase 2C family protein 2/3
MTILVVAILHGRTKEEWYNWITNRGKQEYGYKTPQVLPQIYPQGRLSYFNAKREALEAREKLNEKPRNNRAQVIRTRRAGWHLL